MNLAGKLRARIATQLLLLGNRVLQGKARAEARNGVIRVLDGAKRGAAANDLLDALDSSLAENRRASGAGRDGPAPVDNADTIADLEALGSTPAFIDKLAGVFWADNLKLIAKMEAALSGRNVGEFRNHLHAMKGSAASMGAERLAGFCRDIGRLTDSEIRLRIPALSKTIREELAAAREALEHYPRKSRRSAGTPTVRRRGHGIRGPGADTIPVFPDRTA